MPGSTRITYDVACNFDPELVEIVHRHNDHGVVSSMMGAHRSDLCGGNQPAHACVDDQLGELGRYVTLCHERGLKFNYLMDSACSSNREVFPQEHKLLLKSIDETVERGIDGVTVNSPLLCSVISKRHPHLEVRIGLQARVATGKHVVQWSEVGATAMTLGDTVTRDFAALKSILQVAKRLKVKLRMVANSGCLRDCPYQNSHASTLAHSNRVAQNGRLLFLDYNLLQCTCDKLSSPAKLIASDWIRPEDVSHYEDLCHEAGFDDFGLVLLDSWKPTDFLARVVLAYTSRSYDGNLLDLLNLPQNGGWKYLAEQTAVTATEQGCDRPDILRLERHFDLPKVVIDNKALDGFLEPFLRGLPCQARVCSGSPGVKSESPVVCNHCSVWADKAVAVNAGEVERWKANAEDLLESIKTSRAFVAPDA